MRGEERDERLGSLTLAKSAMNGFSMARVLSANITLLEPRAGCTRMRPSENRPCGPQMVHWRLAGFVLTMREGVSHSTSLKWESKRPR